ncbi:hypothetical protein [Sinobaca sp. H24]|uniref:hypothetical protein n=1 Tax=Sinobaca sp. H24 TaxID=2923376 RepID=UPI002079B20F|nr:hypothetical protein [Sinobaca sp. H24]
MKRGTHQKVLMGAGLFVILAAGCSQEEAAPAAEEAESAEVSEEEEAAPETEEAVEEPAVEEQEAEGEESQADEAESDSEEQQETSSEETVEEEKGEASQEELAEFARDWLILDDETGNFISFRVKLAEDENTLQATYDGFQSGEVEVIYEITSLKNGVLNMEGDIEHMGGSKITLELLDNDRLLWKHPTKELTFDTEEDAIAKDIERNENQSNGELNETNSSSESTADSTSEAAAESETASEPDTESMSLEEQLVEELIQYGIGNGGTRDSFTFYEQAWETGADGNQYYVMIIGDASVGETERIHTFHGGEDGHLYFLNLDAFPDAETVEYTRVDSY